MSSMTDAPRTYRGLFAIRGFPRLAASMFLGRTAGSMYGLILILFTLERYGSPTIAGAATFLSIAPGLVVSPIAGALLDRHGRARLVVLDYIVAAFAFTALAVLSSADRLPVGLLFVIVMLASLTFPLSQVGMRTLFPRIVPRPLWERANAIDSNGYTIAGIFGPAAAGALVATVGAGAALFAPAVLVAFAAVIASGIHDPVERASGRSLLADAWSGLLHVVRHATLRGLAVSVSVANLGSGIFFLALPVLMLGRLGQSSAVVGQVFALMGVAGFVSTLLIGRVGSEGRERTLLGVALFALSAATLVILFFPNLLAIAFAVLVMGIASGPLGVVMFSLRQRRTDPAWHGRAFAVSMAANFSGVPLGSALGGLVIPVSLELAFALAAFFAAVGAALTFGLIPKRA